jgi:hypothetical protein
VEEIRVGRLGMKGSRDNGWIECGEGNCFEQENIGIEEKEVDATQSRIRSNSKTDNIDVRKI